ncbi:MAG: hypothetical protein LW823_06350 [Rickettsiales bacterium]|jgi:hypothetical protein|nr:hypothetical protein [Rickettsiales bacterium]
MNYTASSSPLKPALTTAEEKAICWCADEQVRIAIKHGTITPSQAEQHWFQVAQDLINEPELLGMMVRGHKRSARNARITSTRIYQEYDQEKEAAAPDSDLLEPKNQHPRATAIAGAIVLAAAAPLSQVFANNSAYAPASSSMTSGANWPRKESELPPHERPHVVRVGKKRDENEEPGAGRQK